MAFKKYMLMLSLAIVTVLSIPTFASAKTVDLLAGKQFYKNKYGAGSIYKGNEDSYGYLYEREVITDLGKEFYIKTLHIQRRAEFTLLIYLFMILISEE
ncbi:hypothetical protein AAHB94_33510 [Bacillus toyonensis]